MPPEVSKPPRAFSTPWKPTGPLDAFGEERSFRSWRVWLGLPAKEHAALVTLAGTYNDHPVAGIERGCLRLVNLGKGATGMTCVRLDEFILREADCRLFADWRAAMPIATAIIECAVRERA